MTFKKCRNSGCEIMIEVRNTAEGWRPYEESGNMHQCQFSPYALKQRAVQQPSNNNHNGGNEDVDRRSFDEVAKTVKGWIPTKEQADQVAEETKNYVDHTMAGIPQIITVVGDSPEEMDDLANSWLKKEAGRIRFKGGQRAVRNKDDRHEITLYYEEIGAKQ